MNNQVWYMKIGSNSDLVQSAIIDARASGSIGATRSEVDAYGRITRTATVRREGYQESDYVVVQ